MLGVGNRDQSAARGRGGKPLGRFGLDHITASRPYHQDRAGDPRHPLDAVEGMQAARGAAIQLVNPLAIGELAK